MFTAVLAIQALKGKNREIAVEEMKMPAYGYENAIVGYFDLFDRYVEDEFKEEAKN